MLEHDFFVLFPVQPLTLARYRNAFTTSGAKDDPTDAEFALELSAAIEGLDEEIARLCPELPDYDLFPALPGAGPALAPRLLVAFGERRDWVHWRYSCSTLLRQTFIECVGQTIPRSFWANAFYQGCRDGGMRHQAALRALAFEWIRILHRCWVDRVPYDESRP